MSHDTPASADESRTVIISLGKKSRKQVKRLHKGKGKLVAKVADLVDELRADDQILPSDTIVVVVEQKQKRFKMPW